MLQPIAEQRPVGEARQWVFERLPSQLLLHGALLGDVAVGHRHATDRRIVREVLAEGHDAAPSAVRVANPDLGVHLRPWGRGELLHVRPGQGRVLRVNEGGCLGAETLFDGISQHPLDGRAFVDDLPLLVQDREDVARVLHERPEPSLRARLRSAHEPEQTHDQAAGHDHGDKRVHRLAARGLLGIRVIRGLRR